MLPGGCFFFFFLYMKEWTYESVQNFEGSEILFYLQANELSYHNFFYITIL